MKSNCSEVIKPLSYLPLRANIVVKINSELFLFIADILCPLPYTADCIPGSLCAYTSGRCLLQKSCFLQLVGLFKICSVEAFFETR